jgi:hypothetical protein
MTDSSCPAYHNPNCIIRNSNCPHSDKRGCVDYINYVPKRPISKQVWEGININRIGNPLGAIEKALGEL